MNAIEFDFIEIAYPRVIECGEHIEKEEEKHRTREDEYRTSMWEKSAILPNGTRTWIKYPLIAEHSINQTK